MELRNQTRDAVVGTVQKEMQEVKMQKKNNAVTLNRILTLQMQIKYLNYTLMTRLQMVQQARIHEKPGRYETCALYNICKSNCTNPPICKT